MKGEKENTLKLTARVKVIKELNFMPGVGNDHGNPDKTRLVLLAR